MMGQRNELEMTLAAIRRKKQLYKKNLNLIGMTDERRDRLRKSIELLSLEEEKILDQLGYV